MPTIPPGSLSVADWITSNLEAHRAALDAHASLGEHIYDQGSELVALARHAGMSWDTIGNVFGISGNTARMRWNRGAI